MAKEKSLSLRCVRPSLVGGKPVKVGAVATYERAEAWALLSTRRFVVDDGTKPPSKADKAADKQADKAEK